MFPKPTTPGAEIEGAGGAYVRRRFTFGERQMINGDKLTAEELAGIPLANLHSLINLNLIELFPAPPPSDEAELRAALTEKNVEIERLTALLSQQVSPSAAVGDCFLMPDETGKKFDIIVGRRVTDTPLSRVQAMAKMKELSP